MNIKAEIGEHKHNITRLENQLSSCHSEKLKQHLSYELRQERLKLESCELLAELVRKAGRSL